MGLELEDEEYDVDEEQNYACAATDLEGLLIGAMMIAKGSVESSLSVPVSRQLVIRGVILTGSTRLMTLRLRRQALICVTVLL